MAIAVGSRLPDATFRVMTPSGPASRTTDDVFGGKKVALFAVPGAYTPTCQNMHLPGFIENADALKAKGVDLIVCTAVNDVFVLDAWAKITGAQKSIMFLADGNAEFAKALGLSMDAMAAGLGTRSKRYSMLVEDGIVKVLNIEDGPGKADQSGAEKLLSDI